VWIVITHGLIGGGFGGGVKIRLDNNVYLSTLHNVHPCVAGQPVRRDTFVSRPSASGQRDCIKSSLTHFVLYMLFFTYNSL
jgi:hypothetical protein